MKRNLTLLAAACVSLLLWAAILKGCEALAQMPPKQFRGDAQIMVWFTSPATVDHYCKTDRKPHRAYGCANDNMIFMENPCLHEGAYAELLCHEIAHTNGLKHS